MNSHIAVGPVARVEVFELRNEWATLHAVHRLRDGDWAGPDVALRTMSELGDALVRRWNAGTSHLRDDVFAGLLGVAFVGVEVLRKRRHTRIELVASLAPLLRRGGRVMLLVNARRKKRRPRWLRELVAQLEVLAARGTEGHAWKS